MDEEAEIQGTGNKTSVQSVQDRDTRSEGKVKSSASSRR